MLHSILLLGEKRESGTRATKVAPPMFLRDRHFFFSVVVRPGETCLGPDSLNSPCQRASCSVERALNPGVTDCPVTARHEIRHSRPDRGMSVIDTKLALVLMTRLGYLFAGTEPRVTHKSGSNLCISHHPLSNFTVNISFRLIVFSRSGRTFYLSESYFSFDPSTKILEPYKRPDQTINKPSLRKTSAPAAAVCRSTPLTAFHRIKLAARLAKGRHVTLPFPPGPHS